MNTKLVEMPQYKVPQIVKSSEQIKSTAIRQLENFDGDYQRGYDVLVKQAKGTAAEHFTKQVAKYMIELGELS